VCQTLPEIGAEIPNNPTPTNRAQKTRTTPKNRHHYTKTDMSIPGYSKTIHPVRNLPPMRKESPEVVRVLDTMRRELDDKEEGMFDEFCWFAREYPRCYRYHLDCADFRLRTIHKLYEEAHEQLSRMLEPKFESFEVSLGNVMIEQIYWDFESFLSEINIALDLLARVVGTAFDTHMPANFNALCKKPNHSPILDKMKSARNRWVLRLKDYRDCFVHYTPVDTLLQIALVQETDGYHIYGKLPVNPNVRDILGFRFSRRVELLHYACVIHKHMTALDRAVAKEIQRAYKKNEFPKRIRNLFFLGGRER